MIQLDGPSEGAPTVLLTGAAGVLGQALVPALHDFPLICLTHSRSLGGRGATELRGDITQADLGLGRLRYGALCDRVGIVIHAAASTNFTAEGDELKRTNAAGTENIARLADAAGAVLYQVSTAFVHEPARMAAAAAAPQDGELSGASGYLESKARAEAVVSQGSFPSVIFRPSILTGDTSSGKISNFQGLHVLAGRLMKGGLPLLPVRGDGFVDFLPRDYVAGAIAAVVRSGVDEHRCREYWLTAGRSALTVDQVVDHCVELAKPLTGRRPKRPRIVNPEIVDRLIRPALMSELPEKVAGQLELLFQLLPLINTGEPFPSSIGELRASHAIEPAPDLHGVLRTSLEYWAMQSGETPAEQVA